MGRGLRRKIYPYLAAIFLALGLLVAQSRLLAHEIEHQLHHPGAPCATCLVANHVGTTPTSGTLSLPLLLTPSDPSPFLTPAPCRVVTASFYARAPPRCLIR